MRKAALALSLAVAVGFAATGAKSTGPDIYDLDDYQLDSAKDLFDVCTVPPNHPDHALAKAFCVGYFEGGIHLHDALAKADDFPRIACAPDTTTRKELVDVFVAYAKANPQYHSEAPMDAVFRAVVNKWPCDK
jgi:hypothetical protein